MKSKNIFLFVAIVLLFAFFLHVFVLTSAYFEYLPQLYSPYVTMGVGALMLLASILCFVQYFSLKKYYRKTVQSLENIEANKQADSSELSIENDNEVLLPSTDGYDSTTEDLTPVNKEVSVQGELYVEATEEIEPSQNQHDEPVIDFNQLEEDLLTATKMESLFEAAGNWVLKNTDVSYVGFSNITSNEKLSIEYFEEKMPSEVFLVEAVAERTENIHSKDYMHHDMHTISVPYFKKGAIFGFVFFGCPKIDETFAKLDTRSLGPFIRILSTACLVIELAKTKEQRSSLQKAFSSYVPSAIVDLFEHDPSVLKIGGDYENLTIMFTDLRDFTTLSETMPPDNLITVLNEYFSEMSGVIEAFGGTVSKLVGDGILAFFGGPNSPPNHAEKCCEAALTMKKYEEILNGKLMAAGSIRMPLYTRIGISTGKVILGNIGSEKRLDYTVMGPEVNLASRIEAANKNCGTAILISYETFLIVRNTFDCRRAAFMKLKGFSKSVYLFELLGKTKTEKEEKMQLANNLADILGVDAENLLTSNANTNVSAQSAQASFESDDDLEELEELDDADDLEELEELE